MFHSQHGLLPTPLNMSKSNSAASLADTLYEKMADEEDARVCRDIPDSACRVVPRNFFFLIGASTLTKLGDALSNPKTVLAWLLEYLHAPLFLIGLLVPIRESGSMLPQLIIAGYIRRLAVRKWVWVIGSLVQALAIMAIGVSAWLLTGTSAGWTIIGLLVIFSLGRGLCSVAHKDVIGKTIPKTRRGLQTGVSASIAGGLGMLIGLGFLFYGEPANSALFYAVLFLVTGGLWLLAAAVFAAVAETPGATDGGSNALTEAIARMGLLISDRDFRRFVITRALLLCSALTAPYLIVLAQDSHRGELALLGMFIVANGLAETISAPIWGKLADRSSKQVMTLAAMVTALLGMTVFIIATWLPEVHAHRWTYPCLFLILGIAHSGVRLGRKTYIVDLASGNKRTDYVAVSNTTIGLLLLILGAGGALLAGGSAAVVVLLFSLLGLAGTLCARQLPEVQ